MNFTQTVASTNLNLQINANFTSESQDLWALGFLPLPRVFQDA